MAPLPRCKLEVAGTAVTDTVVVGNSVVPLLAAVTGTVIVGNSAVQLLAAVSKRHWPLGMCSAAVALEVEHKLLSWEAEVRRPMQ